MRKQRGYWTKEIAITKALEFSNKRDFKKKYIAAYELLRKNELLESACKHMINIAHPIKWTFENCKNEALKYNIKGDFKKECSWGYLVAKQNGWLNEITQHYIGYKPKIYWTKEKCQEKANKYQYRIDFSKGSSRAYSASIRNGWINDICQHMKKSHMKSFKWTKEKCQEKANKYQYRKEFQIGDKNAYHSAMHNGWLVEICQYMEYKKLPNKYWHSFENCKNEALKYETKTDFVRNSQHVYSIALKNDWISDICKHMIPRGDKYHRCIYVYEFSDGSAYVGLTYNLNKRKKNRKRDINDAVTIHINKTNLIPTITKLTKYLSIKEAIKMEEYYHNKYLNEGWKMLNRTKTGGLGGSNFNE